MPEVRDTPLYWRMLISYTPCPNCHEKVQCQPMHLTRAYCQHCDTSLVVLVSPMKIMDNGPYLAAFQLRTEDGRWSWLEDPGYYDFGKAIVPTIEEKEEKEEKDG